MSNNRLELTGLSELRAALRQLPDDLAKNGGDRVEAATERARSALVQAYPRGDTGKLRAGVRSKIERSGVAVVGTVNSSSPHAHLWEWGTQNRHTRQGWNRGRSPSHQREGLIPIAQRERRTMNGELVEIVRQAGFEVSGVL